jgi:Site-specific DNA methylase
MTLLRRLGNKSKIAKDVQSYFPPHKQYIELFFGAGGMFFNKPKSKYNIVNDKDSEVYNLFSIVQDRKDDLRKCIEEMPIHQDLWNYWKQNQETDPIRRAVRFLFLSNYGYMGKPETLRIGANNTSQIMLDMIDQTWKHLFQVYFTNVDFRDFFRMVSFKDDKERDDTFVYSDSPYVDADNNYGELSGLKWTQEDCFDLYNVLEGCGCKFAMSEFDHPFVIEEAKRRGLNVIMIGERKNIKNRRIEILVTNYQKHSSLF